MKIVANQYKGPDIRPGDRIKCVGGGRYTWSSFEQVESIDGDTIKLLGFPDLVEWKIYHQWVIERDGRILM